jgi:hypothetical protein
MKKEEEKKERKENKEWEMKIDQKESACVHFSYI